MLTNELKYVIKENKETYGNASANNMLRLSLLQGRVIEMIGRAGSMEEVKEIYDAYKTVSENTPV